MRISTLVPVCLLALALFAGTATSAIVLRVTVEDLADKATVIVSGEVIESKARWTDDHSTINTYVRIAVSNVHKGEAGAEVVVTCQGGAVGDEKVPVEGVPEFTAGEQVLVFLWKNSRGDLLPLGMNQGKFLIEKDPETGEVMARNSLKGLCFARIGSSKSSGPSLKKADVLALADLERRVRDRLAKREEAKPAEESGEAPKPEEGKPAEDTASPKDTSEKPKEDTPGEHANQPGEEKDPPEGEKPEEKKPEEKKPVEKPTPPRSEPEKKKPEEETPPGRR
ncbi:MAG: hypothetical protein ACYS99_04895 [Planctomycetota bacterium]|jgi:hypothetical protein